MRKELLEYALTKREAYLDHPWGEDVVRVAKKVFVFFGVAGTEGGGGMTVKLPASQPLAVAQPGVTPSRYGLGDSGWVTVKFAEADLPFEILREWIDESYEAVAPKAPAKRVTASDQRPA